MTFTSRDLRDQVVIATDASDGTYNVDAIVEEIVEQHGAVPVDDLEHDEFWGIVIKHATEETTYTYAIEISDDGQSWMPENDDAAGTEQTTDTAEEYARTVLGNWVDDLPADQRGGYRRIVVWAGEHQDTIDMAVAVIPA